MDAFDIQGIDGVIHGRLRLGVMAYLVGRQGADFNELKARLKATDGNLSIHLRKLEDAGYVVIQKSFVDRKPLTRIALTPSGRGAFVAYLDAMSKLVGRAAADDTEPSRSPRPSRSQNALDAFLAQ